MKVIIDTDNLKEYLQEEVYKTDLSEVMPIIDHYCKCFNEIPNNATNGDMIELKQESKTGHWVRNKDWEYHCDQCKTKAPFSWTDGEGFDCIVTPYCPQCGVKMEEWEDANEEWYVHRDEVHGKTESEGEE